MIVLLNRCVKIQKRKDQPIVFNEEWLKQKTVLHGLNVKKITHNRVLLVGFVVKNIC